MSKLKSQCDKVASGSHNTDAIRSPGLDWTSAMICRCKSIRQLHTHNWHLTNEHVHSPIFWVRDSCNKTTVYKIADNLLRRFRKWRAYNWPWDYHVLKGRKPSGRFKRYLIIHGRKRTSYDAKRETAWTVQRQGESSTTELFGLNLEIQWQTGDEISTRKKISNERSPLSPQVPLALGHRHFKGRRN